MEIQQFMEAIKQLQHFDSIKLSVLANEIKASLELFSTDYSKLGHALYRLCQQIMKIKDVNNQNVQIYQDLICQVIQISIKHDFKVGYDALRFVFNTNSEYYKTANIDLSLAYPIGKNHILKQYNPQVGQQCDTVRPYITSTSFCGWTRCTILDIQNSKYTLKYANSTNPNTTRQKPFFAPLGSRTKDFEWRMSLDVGSPVQALMNRVWYKSTIAEVGEQHGTKKVRITYRRFDQNGDRSDSNGNKYFGLGIGEDQWMDVTSSRIQQCGKMVINKLCYYTVTSQQILFDDSYDIVFEQQFKQTPFYAIMRIILCKSLSLIKFIDTFVSLKGIEKTLELMDNLESNNDNAYQMLANIGVMVQFFPRMFLTSSPLLRNLYNKIFSFFIASAKTLNVYKLDMGYFCYDMLGRRLLSLSQIHYDQGQLRKALARQFLKMNMEKQMLALRYLNDLISPKKPYTQEQRQAFNKFLKDEKIFEQIFNSNVHQQIISRSVSLLQYLIQKQIISISQFESLWKIFSASDTRGRSIIEKLLTETSKNIPLNYVKFLIQKILSFKQSQLTIDNLNLLKELKNREIDNQSQNKILSFLWDLLTVKSGNVKQNIEEEIEKVFKAFVSTIKDPKVRMNLLESMCQKLQQCKKIRNQIQLLKDFVNSFPNVYVKQKGEQNAQDYIPINIYQAVNFIKSKGIYPGLINLLSITKDQGIKKDILGFFGFLFQNDMSDVNQIIKQIYKTMGPSQIFLQWVRKNMGRSIIFINEFLQKTTDFTLFENIPSKGFEAIQDMIIDVNSMNKKIKVVKTFIYKPSTTEVSSKDKKQQNKTGFDPEIKNHFFVLVSPFQLIGMKFLQNLLQVVKQSKIYNMIIKLMIQFISNLDESIQSKTQDFRRQFLSEITREIKLIQQQKAPDQKSKTKLQVFINLFQQIFSQTEKHGLDDIKPHFQSVEGEMLNLNIINLFDEKPDKKKKQSLPKFTIICNENQTLWNLKRKIMQAIGQRIEDIDVIKYSDPIPDTNHGKSLTELLFYDNESIKIDKTKPKVIPKGNLLNDDKTDVSQKLQKVIQIYFNFYKNKEINGFTMAQLEKIQNQCWKTPYYREKANLEKILQQYDKDKKGFLTYEDFKQFFFLEAKKSEVGVWRILNLSGFRNDFSPYSRAKHLVPDYTTYAVHKLANSALLPRKILSTPQFYSLIYSLLQNENLKQQHLGIYNLLCMLETDTNLKENLQNKINKIIEEQKSYFILCYILEIFNSYLTKKGQIYHSFWQNGGIYVISKRVRQFGQDKMIYQNQPIVKNVVIPSLLKILNMYVREILSDSKLVRFISVSKINHFDPKDFVKKITQLKIDEEELPLTEAGKKLRQLKDYQLILKNLYDLNDFLLQNLMKNYASQKAEYLQKLTVEVVRLISCLISSNEAYHRFHPSQYLYGITNGSLNYRRSSIIIIYISLFFSKSKSSNEIEQIILEMFENMPKQNKYEFEEYFIFLGQLVSRYLDMNLKNDSKDEFFINLGNRMLDALLSKEEGQSRSSYSSDKIIAGILSIISIIIKKDSICKQLAKRKVEITQKCLFAYGIEEKVQKLEILPEMLVSKNQSLHFKGYVLCKTEDSREHTYKIISRLHQLTSDDDYLNTHILPIIKSIRQEVRLTGQKNLAVGLKNFGSTCYMNSMLQVLNSLSPFRNTLIRSKSDSNVIKELKKVFAALYFSERIDYAPFDLLNSFVPPINPSLQQDTTQFLNFLCDQLETALANTRQKKLLDEMFKGANTVQMICHSCGYKKQNKEQFFCLGVQIEQKVNLESALQDSHKGEIISDYLCDSCKNRGETTKRNLLSEIPSVLFIHLRRIVFNYDLFVNMKIHTRLQFPEQLNIQPFTKEGIQLRQNLGLQYMKNLSHNEVEAQKFKKMTQHGKQPDFYKLKLKGVIVHSGSADVGHYYSILETDKSWRKYDDSRIGVFTQSDFQNYCYGGTFVADQWGTGTSANAYVLVYEKVIKNELQFFPQEEGKQKQLVKYDDIKDYNTPEDYRSFWLDNHRFMLETQLLDPKMGKQFIRMVCNLLSSSKSCPNKPQIISETLYRVIYHSEYIGDLYKITIQNANSFDETILNNYVLKDKARTFKLLMNYDRSVRDFMSMYLHVSLLQSYKKGDEVIKAKVISYICELLSALPGDVAKNWMRIDGYFKLLNNLVTSSISFPEIWKLLVSKNLISTLIDFILQKQSPVKINPKNYSLGTKSNPVQFSYALSIISFMLKHTYGFTGKNYEVIQIPPQFLFHLSNNDVVCLSHMQFYRKMFAERQNLYQLAAIIHRLCLENLAFSRAICQVILESMNSITDSKDEMLDFCHVCLQVLRIKDEFWANRAEMLIGVGLPSVLNQNLMANFDDQRFSFTSTIYDIFPIQCLFSYCYLYRLKNTLACFQIVRTILQGCSISDQAMKYLIQQPSPTYLFPSLFSWMQNFVHTFISLVSVQKKQKARLQQEIANTIKYIQDYKDFMLNNPNMRVYKPVITGEIVNKRQIQKLQKDGVEIKIIQHDVYCMKSCPTVIGGNTEFEPYLQQYKKAKSIKKQSDIFKFIKNPGKTIVLKLAPVQENEDKQLVSLFDEEPYTAQKPQKSHQIQKPKQQQQKKEPQPLPLPIKTETDVPVDPEIDIPIQGKFISDYFRQIQVTNISKDKKVVELTFAADDQTNFIVPKNYSWKMFSKTNQSLWIAKQDVSQKWNNVHMRFTIQEYVKQKHEKKNINSWNFKIYNNDVQLEQQEQKQEDELFQKADQPVEAKPQQSKDNQEFKSDLLQCQVCTYNNPVTNSTCEMCQSPLF